MELNSKKLETTTRAIYYTISVVLCLFLILLSNRIIDDVDRVSISPGPNDYEDRAAIAKQQSEIEKLNLRDAELATKRQSIQKAISVSRENYTNEKQSFDNWVETRKTIGSPGKDKEVVDRANKLDEFYKIQQDWRRQEDSINTLSAAVNKQKVGFQDAIMKQNDLAAGLYQKAMKRYELKVFLIRLLFVGPILAIGIFFFIRYRRHKYWPLFFAVTLFSLYAFFVGLVPYLPSYGGYVRYSVGVLLTAGVGYYAIKRIRTYMEFKQSELKVSTQVRAKNVQSEVAEKALDNHICPSCGKDFILKKWEMPSLGQGEVETYKLVTTYCRHCGLELFKNCNNCGTRNFAHIPFCSTCGVNLNEQVSESKASEPQI